MKLDLFWSLKLSWGFFVFTHSQGFGGILLADLLYNKPRSADLGLISPPVSFCLINRSVYFMPHWGYKIDFKLYKKLSQRVMTIYNEEQSLLESVTTTLSSLNWSKSDKPQTTAQSRWAASVFVFCCCQHIVQNHCPVGEPDHCADRPGMTLARTHWVLC